MLPLHHDPMLGRAYPFQSTCVRHRPTPSFRVSPVVALRIELSATRLSAVSGQPALDYRAVEVGTVGLEPTISCFQNTRACRYPTSRCSVRTAGFEPAISWPPTRRDNQASLRSDQVVASSPDQPRGRCPESNPSHRLERAASFTNRRTGRHQKKSVLAQALS